MNGIISQKGASVRRLSPEDPKHKRLDTSTPLTRLPRTGVPVGIPPLGGSPCGPPRSWSVGPVSDHFRRETPYPTTSRCTLRVGEEVGVPSAQTEKTLPSSRWDSTPSSHSGPVSLWVGSRARGGVGGARRVVRDRVGSSTHRC